MKPPLAHGKPNDFQTPPVALAPLIPHLKKDWKIWEPAAGTGNLVDELRRLGFEVIASDIIEHYALGPERDFLSWRPEVDFDCIITSPPYSLKQQFLERCYQLGKPFALLLPLTTFETRKRQQLFAKHGVEVIFFDRRINFEMPDGMGEGAWFMTAWFTCGLNIGKQLTFTILKPTGQATIAENTGGDVRWQPRE